MQINLATEYAIRALLFLAKQPLDSLTQTSAIAKDGDIPKPFLQKILGNLTKSNLIVSIRGIKGGIKLAKKPDEISLLEIIEIMEGRIFFNRCFFEHDFCHRTNWCSVHAAWSEAQKLVRDLLRKKSLQYLIEQNDNNSCAIIHY